VCVAEDTVTRHRIVIILCKGVYWSHIIKKMLCIPWCVIVVYIASYFTQVNNSDYQKHCLS